MTYPVTTELRQALETLYEDPSVGLGFLGNGLEFLEPDAKETSVDPSVSIQGRSRMLREKLESYVLQLAAEAIEFGEHEVPRLRNEATGLLIALREISHHLPDTDPN